ncbi:LLM class flavin-dependent oxidoreductase [Herbiconiux sp. P15]|uniref:LLM class flavin-dependent oxidoreductase n=1 Tax=Herbiconiux liukaitaii TaxID=3342799 RepID=UPI0035BA5169
MSMERLEIGLGLNSAGTKLRTLVDLAVQAEDAGFDIVSAGDSGTETFAIMGAIAVSTSRIQMISGIAGWSRSPATMAHAASTVANLSDGRFTLGIGPTPKMWVNGWHGLEFDPVIPRMREYLIAVRAALDATSEQPTDVDGEYFPTHGYANWDIELPSPVPIALGVTQRRMTELAGEVCDGVMMNSIIPMQWIEQFGNGYLSAGQARAGREGTPFTREISRFVGVDEDRAHAYDLCRAQLSFYFEIPYFRSILEPFGFDEELAAGEKAILDGDRAARIAAVSDRMVEEIGIAGTPAEVVEKLARYERLVDSVVLHGALTLDGDVAQRNIQRIIQTFGRSAV